jgi:succinyl-diaminopimelate desuccinylase
VLNVAGDIRDLVCDVVDIESVSGQEERLAGLVESTLKEYDHLQVTRLGNTVVAQTSSTGGGRVIIAGHLDTVPITENLPSYRSTKDARDIVVGRGTTDMKAGIAVQLALAAELSQASYDLTWIFYDCEEIEASRNGLGRLVDLRPDLVTGDMAILMEPTNAKIEAGCQGTIRAEILTQGVAAHSARAWMGHNAIHEMARALKVLEDYSTAEVDIDGLVYRESLNAVNIAGGIAGNVIPDRCLLQVNYRFAPNKSESEAVDELRGLFAGYQLEVVDSAPGALPGLTSVMLTSFVESVGHVLPKYGWTDVARFAQLGIPALNYGPGDPNLAHTSEEYVFLDTVEECRDTLRRWLTS